MYILVHTLLWPLQSLYLLFLGVCDRWNGGQSKKETELQKDIFPEVKKSLFGILK